jgi:hypothetical protein
MHGYRERHRVFGLRVELAQRNHGHAAQAFHGAAHRREGIEGQHRVAAVERVDVVPHVVAELDRVQAPAETLAVGADELVEHFDHGGESALHGAHDLFAEDVGAVEIARDDLARHVDRGAGDGRTLGGAHGSARTREQERKQRDPRAL